MMPRLKCLKIHTYRGVKIYIRHLWGEKFEILIPAYGQLYDHPHEFNKPAGKRYHDYTNDELTNVVAALCELGEVLLDDIIFQWTESNKITNRIKRSWNKINQYTKRICQRLVVRMTQMAALKPLKSHSEAPREVPEKK